MTQLFDLEVVVREFQAAKTEDDQILLDPFLKGYSELILFFDLLGAAFGFIGRDLKDKSRILREHMSENPEHFVSTQSMVSYELQNKLTKKTTSSGLPSGSRTLLRLNRALDFFIRFISRLREAPMDGKTSTIASETYSETLAKYHPWLVRQAGYLAIRILPNKEVFVERYCKQDVERLVELADPAVTAMQDIYDVTFALYSQHDILDLP